MWRLTDLIGTTLRLFTLAHLARCAAAIRRRAAADIVFRLTVVGLIAELLLESPRSAVIAASRRSRSARSCWMICSIGMAGIVACCPGVESQRSATNPRRAFFAARDEYSCDSADSNEHLLTPGIQFVI